MRPFAGTGTCWTLLMVLLCAIPGLAQQSVVSGNSKFVGVWNYEGKDKLTNVHTYEIKVYSVAYKSLIQSVKARLREKTLPDSVWLSDNGKLLYLHQEPEHHVYNVRTGRLVAKFNFPVKIAAAHEDNFFVASNNLWVKGFDSYTGEELENYQAASDNKIRSLLVTADDALIVGQTDRNQVIFWQAGAPKARKKFYGQEIVLDQEGKTFTILRAGAGTFSTMTYSLPEFRRLKKQSIEKILRDRARAETLEIRKTDPTRKNVIVKPSKFLDQGYRLSTVGNYLSFFAASPSDEKEIYVLNTITGEVLLQAVAGTQKHPVEVRWYNDSLMIPVNALKAGVFNARQASFDQQLDLEFLTDGKVKDKVLNEKRRISPDFALSAFVTPGSLLLKSTRKSNTQLDLGDHTWLGFSSNSKYIFVKDPGSGRVGYLKAESVSGGRPEVVYFDENKRDYKEDIIKEENTELYAADRITGFRHISEARAGDSLRIIMKTVESGKHSGVQVQILDRNGFYYYGAGEDLWKKIWCNLMVKGSDGKVKQVKDFTVTENRMTDTLPNAIAVVMDFSGSMGWPRADALQDGVEKFIRSKNSNDQVALVKYDSQVLLESRLDNNVPRLLKKLYRTDYSHFGGATALLDAINSGIFAVANANNSGKKLVLAMTDGFENASMATRNEVLAHAVKSGVNIVTIGFGDQVDQGYLKSLSYTTYGGHYQLYQTDDLDWIFTDIYQKANNYYSVNYHTEDAGSQVYMLKICYEGMVSDSLAVEYDNNPVDVQLLLENDDVYKPNPVKTTALKPDQLKGFNYPELKDFSKVKSRLAGRSKQVVEDEDRITTIEEEFMNIELPKFNFYYDEIRTVQETEKRISELADFLRKYPDIRLEIIGHTDNSGTTEYNDRLSLDRAEKVRKLIVDKGIPASRFEVKGYGETSPVSDNTSEAGRGRNRRVEFRIIAQQQ